jgi:hypothetical protein
MVAVFIPSSKVELKSSYFIRINLGLNKNKKKLSQAIIFKKRLKRTYRTHLTIILNENLNVVFLIVNYLC